MTTFPEMNPPSHQQDRIPAGLLSAEPPVRALADAGIIAAIRELQLAAPAMQKVGASWMNIQDTPTDYRDLVDAWVRDVQFAKANRDRSDSAKWTRVQAITREFRSNAETLLRDYTLAHESLLRRYESQTRPPAPTADGAALEGMLQNARLDARMTLDAAEDADLADRLAELAVDGGPALQFLLLATPWVGTFLRARGAVGAPMMWEQRRRDVLAQVLDATAVLALPKLDALAHVRKAGHALRGGHELTISHNSGMFAAE